MASVLPFPEWKPDVSDYQGASSQTIQNVLPRGDGYGPAPDFSVLTSALAGTCRGYFRAINADGSITIFAATSTNLYKLDNSTFTWSNVSKGGGPYSGILSSDQWQFAQFGSVVIAVQINVPPQAWTLGSSTAFADLGGSPPQCKYIAVVNRFLVLTGISGHPYRVQWSGLDSITTWDGTLQSDQQDLPDGGLVRGIAGGESGVICQDAALRSMVFLPGDTQVTFQIERIAQDKGIFAPLSLIAAKDRVFFILNDGFYMYVPGQALVPFGKEKFDRYFFANVDTAALQYCIGAASPKSTLVLFAFKSLSGAAGFFDTIIAYDYALQRGTLIKLTGEYLATLAKPGLTLENLDLIAPGEVAVTGAANNGSGLIRLAVASTTGWATNDIKAVSSVGGTTEANGNWKITVINSTHIDLQGSTFTNAYTSGGIVGGSLDALSFSLDDISTGTLAQLSGVNSSHQLCFLSGPALEATLTTAEQGDSTRRVRVQGFRPITDAASAVGSTLCRDRLIDAITQTTEQPINSVGVVPQNKSTRYARAQLRIPYGSSWTFATGVEPMARPEGKQ